MKTILAILVGSAFVLAVGMSLQKKANDVVDNRLPSLAEIQEAIGATPDGIYGPETKRLWEEATHNQYYKDSLERMGL